MKAKSERQHLLTILELTKQTMEGSPYLKAQYKRLKAQLAPTKTQITSIKKKKKTNAKR